MNIHALSIHDLHAVSAVASHEHFGRAAQALRVAQPTLSAQVQKVERMLGAQLFERTARRFLVTSDGQRLLPLIREVLSAAERLHAATAAGQEIANRPLRLGIIPTLGPYFMPHLLLPMHRQHVPIELAINEHQTADLLKLLLDGTLEAAILSLPVRSEALEFVDLFDEPFKLIAPRESEIVNVDKLVPSRLCACDMVLLEDGHCLRDQAVAVCGRRGGSSPRMVTTSLETLKYLIAAGNGYSLLPALACDLPKELSALVRLRDFDERVPSRRIGLCYRRSMARRDEVLALCEFIRRFPPPDVVPISDDDSGAHAQANRRRKRADTR